MNFTNWSYCLDALIDFYHSEIFEIVCNSDNVIMRLFYSQITCLGNNLVCPIVAQIYYGENSQFDVDALIKDFIAFEHAIVPNLKDSFGEPEPLIPGFGADLDYKHGTMLNTPEELYQFIVKGIVPKKESVYISNDYAIRQNVIER